MEPKEHIGEIIEALEREYPMAECTLDHNAAYELLVGVRLAAQCTDARVNMVTPALFAAYPTAADMAKAEPEDIEPYIHSCGFYRGKARDIVGAARMVVNEFGGKVPDSMENLLRLPVWGERARISSSGTCITFRELWWWIPTASGLPTASDLWM